MVTGVASAALRRAAPGCAACAARSGANRIAAGTVRGLTALAGAGTLRGGRRNVLRSRPRQIAGGATGPFTVRAFSTHKDYYELLGVDRDVDAKTLKKRFRELAKKYHPDSSKEEDATTKFQEINHAYDVLSDPQKRQAYDTFGPDFEQAGAGGPGGGMGGMGGMGFDFEDIFGGRGFGGFGGQGGFRQPGGRQVGADANVGLHLSFMEAAMGCTKNVDYSVDDTCSSCSGTGSKAGEKKKTATCSACGGQGVRLQSVGGIFQVPTPCTQCQGTGENILNKCTTCRGSGVEQQTKSVTLNIPAGVDSGMTLSQAGAGHAGRQGGPSGDLLVELRVGSDPHFKRKGTNIFSEVEISLAQAVLGDKVPVRTLEGDVDLKVPSGVKNGEVRRLRGRGVPEVNRFSAKGDQFVTFLVQMPKDLTDRQRELIKEFDVEEKAKLKTRK